MLGAFDKGVKMITIVDAVKALYPGAVENNLVYFKAPTGDIEIDTWQVAGVEQPNLDYLKEYVSANSGALHLNQVKEEVLVKIYILLNNEAVKKGYKSELSMASYLNSTNEVWRLQATNFIQWRDSVWNYCYLQFDLALTNQREIISADEFMLELPTLEQI